MADPLPNVPNVLKLQFIGANSGTPWLMGLFWHYNAATLITGDINSLCAGAATAWQTNLASVHGTAVTLTRVQGIDLRARDAAQGGIDVSYPGTLGGVTYPASVAAVCSWKVNYRWRGGHFRSYMPAGVAGNITGGRLWSTAFLASLNTAVDAFRNALNGLTVGGTGGHLSGVRYVVDKVPLTVPLDLPIVDSTVHQRVDTQRRRLGREVA
jgi:hypothetical protein